MGCACVNTASRLQQMAPVGGVVVGEVTYQATRDAIAYEPLKPAALKGKGKPVPLWLAKGAGAESRTQIGWVIVGGMAFGTLLTLFVVPTAYTLLAGRRARDEAEAEHALPAYGATPAVHAGD